MTCDGEIFDFFEDVKSAEKKNGRLESLLDCDIRPAIDSSLTATNQ